MKNLNILSLYLLHNISVICIYINNNIYFFYNGKLKHNLDINLYLASQLKKCLKMSIY